MVDESGGRSPANAVLLLTDKSGKKCSCHLPTSLSIMCCVLNCVRFLPWHPLYSVWRPISYRLCSAYQCRSAGRLIFPFHVCVLPKLLWKYLLNGKRPVCWHRRLFLPPPSGCVWFISRYILGPIHGTSPDFWGFSVVLLYFIILIDHRALSQ